MLVYVWLQIYDLVIIGKRPHQDPAERSEVSVVIDGQTSLAPLTTQICPYQYFNVNGRKNVGHLLCPASLDWTLLGSFFITVSLTIHHFHFASHRR